MDSAFVATKGNLMRAKASLALSKQGFELMDKKRSILIMELMSLIDRADKIQNNIDSTYSQAYEALMRANLDLGLHMVEKYCRTIPKEESLTIKLRSVMGVEIPEVSIADPSSTPYYGMMDSSPSLDEALKKFEQVKLFTVELAEVENSAYRLAMSIKKTQKRANALTNILIPRYQKLVKDIQISLEEKEREEFIRLKVIKHKK
ncbi:MAG: V-type ATP synthase subunit D [Bacillota bacterium]|nr:V-type ATP synthase subunit D [Bacillota bacterium]